MRSLEFQAGLARGIRQRLDAAVVEVAAAVEDYVLDALFLRTLGDQLADGLRRGDAGAGFQALHRRLLQRRGSDQRGALIVVDQLRVDMFAGAENGQPFALAGGKSQDAAHAPPAPLDPVAQPAHYQLRYFFLPSLRKIRSAAYLTPLP